MANTATARAACTTKRRVVVAVHLDASEAESSVLFTVAQLQAATVAGPLKSCTSGAYGAQTPVVAGEVRVLPYFDDFTTQDCGSVAKVEVGSDGITFESVTGTPEITAAYAIEFIPINLR